MLKAPHNPNETSMRLLMNPADQRDHSVQMSDPVEMRRLNYQTPGELHSPLLPFSFIPFFSGTYSLF